jgi:ATP adenylyltransferase
VDVLWSPWRYDYIKSGGAGEKPLSPDCVFCAIQKSAARDEENFILHRAEHNFIVLNIYPYVSGHLMIIPFRHIADLFAVPKEVSDELMDLAKRCQQALGEVYTPDGFNLGMNLGKAAGAGVAGHLHMHIMPRWFGDVNFMTSVGETRTIPEDLRTTYERLKDKF